MKEIINLIAGRLETYEATTLTFTPVPMIRNQILMDLGSRLQQLNADLKQNGNDHRTDVTQAMVEEFNHRADSLTADLIGKLTNAIAFIDASLLSWEVQKAKAAAQTTPAAWEEFLMQVMRTTRPN